MRMVIIHNEQGYAGVRLSAGPLPMAVRGVVPLDDLSAKQANKTAWAVPLSACKVGRASLPGMSGKALRRAVELQNSFQFPEWENAGVATVQQAEGPRGVVYLLCGFDAPGNLRPAVALPEPLAFVALADALGALPGTGAVLIVACSPDRLLTSLVKDNRVGLMREIVAPGNIEQELRLSMQDSYLRPYPTLVSVEKILWFGDPTPADRLPEPLKGLVQSVPGEQVLQSVPTDIPEMQALAAAGMSVAGKKGGDALAAWYMGRKKDSPAKVMRRAGAWLLPLLAVLIGAYLGFSVWLEQQKIAHYNQEISRVRKGYQAVETIRQEYVQLMAFLQDAGRTMKSVGTWEQIFSELDKGRPDGVRVRTVYGNLDQRISVQGRADHFGQVAQYLKILKGKPLFRKMTLRSSTDNSEGKQHWVSFAFELDREEAHDGTE